MIEVHNTKVQVDSNSDQIRRYISVCMHHWSALALFFLLIRSLRDLSSNDIEIMLYDTREFTVEATTAPTRKRQTPDIR